MMNKILFFLSIIALPFSLISQNRNVVINWDFPSVKKTYSKRHDVVKKHSKEDYISAVNLKISDDELSYQYQWRDNGFANENSATISNISYASLTSEEKSKINASLVPDEPKYTIASTKARDIIYTVVTITPIIRTKSGFKKILSFNISYRYKFGQEEGGRIAISNSVLATGNWYKFKVEETGVYRINRSFLEDLGMNTSSIIPANLKIYGHGGQTLPLLNSVDISYDLPQNSIQVVGEEDGSFDNEDYILFYGIGTKGYDAQCDTNENPYDDDSYYYVTADGGPGLRVQEMTEPNGEPNIFIDKFNDYKFHEENDYSVGKLGRRWYGNRFDFENEQNYTFDFSNIVVGDPLGIRIKVASASETNTSMAISINGTSVNPIQFAVISGTQLFDSKEFDTEINNIVIPASGETVTIDLTYNNAGNPSSVGYVDYISVEAMRRLSGTGTQMSFQYNDSRTLVGIGEYQIDNASQFSQIWDVTDTGMIYSKQNSESASDISFKATLGELKKYIAVNPNDYFEPVKSERSVVSNQNLKGTIFNDESGNFKDIDYLIVTSPVLIQPALRLAEIHKRINGLNVKVATTDKIYEEFSSGKQDISAIRNFVRYIYNNASSTENRIKYLCLFGDTSVDYKDRFSNNNNIVPTFHTLFSRSSLSSFMSDDFFGNMDINEGTIGGETPDPITGLPRSDIDRLDIAVGRILADDVLLANQMVDKIENYHSKDSYGNWRNNFVLISDDVDSVFEYQALEVNLDELGDEISSQKPFINVKKIHSDAYQQQASAGGNRYPEVNEAIKNAVEVGALVINYFGHGGEDGLAKEYIYTKDMAEGFKNRNRYPCIVTVTCEFTKFDNPLRITAGELTYWNKEGGAISLVTTTRSIGVTLGVQFNQLLASELFGFGVNTPETPAEALRRSKNQISNDTRRVIFYVGDPAMHLAFPKQKIRLTTLNGSPISQATDTLKALSKVRLGGEVVDENGVLMNDYNGLLEAKVYDKNVNRQTLGNDNIRDANGELLILDFVTLGEGLFNGQATVTNGTFEFEFVVPRDAQIPVDNGRVSLYAQKNMELEDQTGHNLDIKVGGLNEDAPEDNQGPLIQLFMNEESFVSGGITNDSPVLIAKLNDENGINTASGIGHDMIAILDGDESNPYVLNEYYQAEVDDYTKGVTSYTLRDLEEGLHTLTFKAWDVYNNSSTAEIQFVVAGDNSLKITRVLNYPNPFVNYTEFWFNHNRPYEPLEVQVQVFTITGKVVWTKNQIINTDGFLSRDIVWNGLDDFGDKIGKGVYIYKISVKSTLTNQRVEKFEKLVIL